MTCFSVNYIRDIPYVISGNYTVIVGKCISSEPIYGKSRRLDVTIGTTLISTGLAYKNFISEGYTYKIEYLPYSKKVIKVCKI